LKTPAFWGIFSSKFPKEKALLGVVAALICFSHFGKMSHPKKWPFRSVEKCFLKEFF
jgi:hypothetical protein